MQLDKVRQYLKTLNHPFALMVDGKSLKVGQREIHFYSVGLEKDLPTKADLETVRDGTLKMMGKDNPGRVSVFFPPFHHVVINAAGKLQVTVGKAHVRNRVVPSQDELDDVRDIFLELGLKEEEFEVIGVKEAPVPSVVTGSTPPTESDKDA